MKHRVRAPGVAAIVPAAFTLLWGTPAQAHLVDTGFGDFYNGIVHLAVTPADLLVLIGFALLAGQQGTRAARWTVLLLPLAWIVVGALGARAAAAAATLVSPAWTVLTFGAAGALVALRLRLPLGVVVALALLAGALHGAINGATMMSGGASTLALAGAGAAAFCIVSIVAGQVSALRANWTAIGVRVAGSWLAAVAILMLGWMARPPG